MRDPVGRIHTSQDMYLDGEFKVDYSTYLRVLKLYFRGIVSMLLKGYVWNLGSNLATISIQQVKRTYNKPRPDWGRTRSLRKSGEIDATDIVYYTDQPFWYRFYWNKAKAKVLNISAYKFSISTGPLGNSRVLSKHLQSEPLAHLSYGIQNRKQQ